MRGVVVQIVNLIVNAVVFTIGAFGAEGARLKPCMLDGVVVYLLRRPLEVIA